MGNRRVRFICIPANTTSYSDNTVTCGVANYYRIRGFRSGDSVLSHYSITANLTPPCSPPNAAPQRNYFTTDRPTLTWNRVTGAEGYEIQVDTTTNFAAPLVFTTTVPASDLAVTLPSLDDGVYYWRVRALNSSAAGVWSVTESFVVVSP